jgi:hypothetical protein
MAVRANRAKSSRARLPNAVSRRLGGAGTESSLAGTWERTRRPATAAARRMMTCKDSPGGPCPRIKIRNLKQMQSTKHEPETNGCRSRLWDFGFVSSFDIRASNFGQSPPGAASHRSFISLCYLDFIDSGAKGDYAEKERQGDLCKSCSKGVPTHLHRPQGVDHAQVFATQSAGVHSH